MSKKVIFSLLIGSILLFAWNAVSWMVLPFHTQSLKNIPPGVISAEIMREAMPASGVYHYPGYPANFEQATMDQVETQLKAGPRITMMAYVNRPTRLFEPATFGISFFLNVLTVLFTYLLLTRLKSPTFASVFLACMSLAIISALLSDMSLMNWFMFPWGYTLTMVFDKLMSFVLLGLLFGGYTFKS
ncbi:MAG: hypothetical protein AAFU64_18930 [Bacteroidota bacterium]